MKVVIAIDSFKGSLSSLEAGEAAKRGIARRKPDCEGGAQLSHGGWRMRAESCLSL